MLNRHYFPGLSDEQLASELRRYKRILAKKPLDGFWIGQVACAKRELEARRTKVKVTQ